MYVMLCIMYYTLHIVYSILHVIGFLKTGQLQLRPLRQSDDTRFPTLARTLLPCRRWVVEEPTKEKGLEKPAKTAKCQK